MQDATAALAYAADRSDVIDTNRIYLFGRSIGGAVAVAAASGINARFVRGLVIENSFTSIDDMIDVVLPVLGPMKFLNRNKWNSLAKISKLEIPILFIRYAGFIANASAEVLMLVSRTQSGAAPFACEDEVLTFFFSFFFFFAKFKAGSVMSCVPRFIWSGCSKQQGRVRFVECTKSSKDRIMYGRQSPLSCCWKCQETGLTVECFLLYLVCCRIHGFTVELPTVTQSTNL